MLFPKSMIPTASSQMAPVVAPFLTTVPITLLSALFFTTVAGAEPQITPVSSSGAIRQFADSFPKVAAKTPQERSFDLNEEGVRLVLKGKREEGSAKFKESLHLNPENTTALYNLAGLYISLGQPKEAVRVMENAVTLQPDDLSFQNRLAEAHFANNDVDNAIRAYEQLVKVDERYEQGMVRLGTLYGIRHRWDEAESALRKAVAFDVQDSKALGNLGSILVMREKFDEAITVLGRAQEISKTPENSMALGIAKNAKGEIQEALRYFEEAKALGATDPELDVHIQELRKKTAGVTDAAK